MKSRPLWVVGAVVAAAAFVLLFVFPVSGASPTGTKYCYVTIQVSGNVQTVANFYVYGVTMSPSEGTCTILPFPTAQNIFPFSGNAQVSMGGTTQSFQFNCPGLSLSCQFSGSVLFQVQPGTYSIVFSAPGYNVCNQLGMGCNPTQSQGFTVS